MNKKSQNQTTGIIQFLKLVFLFHFTLFSGSSVFAQYITERPDWAGLWFNINNVDFTGFEDVVAGRAGRVQWQNLPMLLEIEPKRQTSVFYGTLTITMGLNPLAPII